MTYARGLLPFLTQMCASYYQNLVANPPKIIVDASAASPDYIPLLAPLVRISQLEYNPVRSYKPAHQNEVFAFVEQYYQLWSEKKMARFRVGSSLAIDAIKPVRSRS